ncbi:subtilase family protein [Actinokineospora auranticolor]|uniref:Subtilase family protein n=1 Tax=Actinokineospora auranticolor TaxID=155976 RepID=A0A2S6GD76_9PSEU|nr:subtilase family protein [Actinokineospora auranticolor]
MDGGPADTDRSGHGTFVAGLIAARPVPRSGFVGLAPAATILPIRVTGDPGAVDPDRLAAGIRRAVDSGARVVAVGLIGTGDTPALRAAVTAARERDVLVVASAAVRRVGQRAFPASLDGVLAVSPVGPDGLAKSVLLGARPALAAPAEQLVGIGPSGSGHRLAAGPELAVGYAAGAAALVRARHPALTAAETITRLTDTADAPAAPDPTIGAGVVNPVAAVTTIAPEPRRTTPPSEHIAIPDRSTVDKRPARVAVWFVAGLAALTLVATGAVTAVAHARRRSGARSRVDP